MYQSAQWPDYGPRNQGTLFRFMKEATDVLLPKTFRPAPGPTQPHIQRTPDTLSVAVKRLAVSS